MVATGRIVLPSEEWLDDSLLGRSSLTEQDESVENAKLVVVALLGTRPVGEKAENRPAALHEVGRLSLMQKQKKGDVEMKGDKGP